MPAPAPLKPPQQMQQQHAISYVTTIRNRFAHEPETYRCFLKILHTYQKEQKGIKDVLEQVSTLFADHPDLLMEFTYFLPDAVQEQAKERLHRAARESEVRRRMQLQQQHQLGALGNKRGRAFDQPGKAAKGMAPVPPKKIQKKQQQRDYMDKSEDGRGGSENEGGVRREGSLGVGNHYSISAERRFFDQVKDLLTSISKDSWTEFVKCLDLFNSDTITKKDLMSLTKNLFGSGNADLFDEFKRLLQNRADYESSGQDMWFAVPLSEIDFSQCSKCTPSYRALPHDFPKILATERSAMEASVLNDDWVSIPIGSEESNSFKHMRKNQYEEALFKCEDDRFEMDMIIDSNACTIRVLEPLAEEIAQLRAMEESHAQNHTMPPRFSFQLEKKSLTTVHLSCIARLYGDHGAEVLELLKKNPAGTIPTILKRLKQKDFEWRKARQDLARQWKDVLEKNFEKSFDHRSFYFRQMDKRVYSSRHLVTELRVGSPEAGVSLDDQKAAGVHFPPFSSPICADTNMPSPAQLREMTVQLVLSFSAEHFSVHRDVYKIMCHAAEVSGITPAEKERLLSLWRDLLRVFFNIPVHLMYPPTPSNFLTLSEPYHLDASEAWQPGTRVVTVFGSGVIKSFRSSDAVYEVTLPWGQAFLRPHTILGAEELSAQAMASVGVEREVNAKGEVKEKVFGKVVSPVASSDKSSPPGFCELFCTQQMYVFLRMHHTLFSRLVQAKTLASQAMATKNMSHPLTHADEEDDEMDVKIHSPVLTNPYKAFFGQVLAVVDGSIDINRFEECSRQLLGNRAFVLYTIDKLMQKMLKASQILATDEVVTKLIGIFVYNRSRGGALDPTQYKKLAQACVAAAPEELYRLQMHPAPDVCKGSHLMTLQGLGMVAGLVTKGGSASTTVTAAASTATAAASAAAGKEEEEEEEEEKMDTEG